MKSEYLAIGMLALGMAFGIIGIAISDGYDRVLSGVWCVGSILYSQGIYNES